MVERAYHWTGKLALIVDDQPDFRTALELFLVALGFRVLSAADGREALTILEHESPDVILLDLFMSGMDGIELLRRLQASRKPIPPVIAITGYVEHQHGVGGAAELLGAKGVLLKPFTREQLEKAIASVLHPPEVTGSAASGLRLGWVPRRVRFVSAASHSVGKNRQFNVQLRRMTGEAIQGEAGGDTPLSELRGPAEATVDALRKMVGASAELELRDILPVAALGQDLLVAALEIVHENKTHRLFGVSPVTDDRTRAVALATLNAANRFLGLG